MTAAASIERWVEWVARDVERRERAASARRRPPRFAERTIRAFDVLRLSRDRDADPRRYAR